MNYFDDAKALLTASKSSLSEIENEYTKSLKEKNVSSILLISIKNFMENLRSALDFSAHGLFEKYGDSTYKGDVYFPYAWKKLDQAGYHKRIDKCVPGLSKNRPDLVAVFDGYQSFSDPSNSWLPKFMDLNNENKHQRLTPQKRKESKVLRLSSGGASISMGEGASVSMGPGSSITMGGMTIPGGQSFDVNRPPITHGSGTKEVITWVSFLFERNGEAVLPFLKNALDGVSKIVEDLSLA